MECVIAHTKKKNEVVIGCMQLDDGLEMCDRKSNEYLNKCNTYNNGTVSVEESAPLFYAIL